MIGDYTFTINDLACQPIYTDDLTLEYSLQPNEYFYKLTLSGELSFVQVDYEYIMAQPFDTRFNVNIYKSGVLYFKGYFTRIDCKENKDDEVIKVALSADDSYDAILNGYDKTHNIVALKPLLANIQIDKRPLIQVYVAGSKTVSCFLAGSYWEQAVNNIEYSDQTLIENFHFSKAKENGYIKVSEGSNYAVAGEYIGYGNTFTKTTGDFKFVRTYINPTYTPYMHMELIRISDNKTIYYTDDFTAENGERTLRVFTGSEVTGRPSVTYEFTRVYSRYLTDIKVVRNLTAYDIPAEDIVVNNNNYRYVIGYAINTCYITTNYSVQPTEYGLNNVGSYFTTPESFFGDKFYPVAKDRWITASIWFRFSYTDWIIEPEWRNTYVLRDAFRLSSVIDRLLKQISPDYYFDESNSIFLYGEGSLKDNDYRLYISPKTNITKSNYNQAAQKAELSLKQILDMLWGVYGCKWHMEENALHIEHILYYKQGRAYIRVGGVGLDLREETHARHYKPYTFQKNSYSYDKQETPETIRFTYTDSVTDVFIGKPIKILSTFVQPGKIEEVNVSVFNPDLDYMLLNPAEVSNDGFALLTAEALPSGYKVPYTEVAIDDIIYRTQNGSLSYFELIPRYHIYDLPGHEINMNGSQFHGTVRLKRLKKQSLWISYPSDLTPYELIQTNEGLGFIEKMSINLTSRRIDLSLRYDTYNPRI